MNRKIEVWADWFGLERPELMGRLCAIETRDKEVFSFECNRSWLKHHAAIPLAQR